MESFTCFVAVAVQAKTGAPGKSARRFDRPRYAGLPAQMQFNIYARPRTGKGMQNLHFMYCSMHHAWEWQSIPEVMSPL